MKCYVCQADVIEKNSHKTFYPDSSTAVILCDGCFNYKQDMK